MHLLFGKNLSAPRVNAYYLSFASFLYSDFNPFFEFHGREETFFRLQPRALTIVFRSQREPRPLPSIRALLICVMPLVLAHFRDARAFSSLVFPLLRQRGPFLDAFRCSNHYPSLPELMHVEKCSTKIVNKVDSAKNCTILLFINFILFNIITRYLSFPGKEPIRSSLSQRLLNGLTCSLVECRISRANMRKDLSIHV